MNLIHLCVAPAPPAPPTGAADNAASEAGAADFSNCLEQACAVLPPASSAKAKAATKVARAPDGPAVAATPALDKKPVPDGANIEATAPIGTAPTDDRSPIDQAPPDLSALLVGWTPPDGPPAPHDAPAPPEAKGVATALANDSRRSKAAERVLEAVAHDRPRRDAARAEEAAELAAVAPPHNQFASPRAAPAPLPIEPPRAAPAPSPIELPRTSPDAALPPRAVETSPATAPSGPTPMPVIAPSAATTTTPHVASATPSAAVAPPPQHPDFAPALAAQVRWWADAGVQHAQLTLNPPEMGPVVVRIVVTEAREARIDFGADLAATRQAIEASLPVLAAALDEGGLTLTGGGVHDNASHREQAWQQARAQAGKPALAPHASAVIERTHPRAVAARGIVDLVA
jgi:flagellar hook-length control protein FliK